MSQEPKVIVSVETEYLPGQFADSEQKYAFVYHIRIANESDKQVQLLSRYWLITDANGEKTEVKGDGVVGEQPVISPGNSYQYSSGAVLETPVGSMQGYYEMLDEQQQTFRVPIPVFRLAIPSLIN